MIVFISHFHYQIVVNTLCYFDDLDPTNIGTGNLFVGVDFVGSLVATIHYTRFPTSKSVRYDFDRDTNLRGLANSRNIFPYPDVKHDAQLVRAICDHENSYAIMRQVDGKTRLTMYVPPEEISVGKNFAFPVASLGKQAQLLLGNPTAFTAKAMVDDHGKTSTILVEPEGLNRMSLNLPATSNIVESDVPIIAQLKIDYGDHVEMTMLIPQNR